MHDDGEPTGDGPELDPILRTSAIAVLEHAHRPYSGLAVGAAVEVALRDGSRAVLSGANVENASYGLTMCAERVAIGSAVSAGAVRVLRVVIAVDAEHPLPPCGACRQVIAEFAAPDVEVLCISTGGGEQRTTVGELLPGAMGAGDLPSSAQSGPSPQA